jgi:hypothetical protein
MCVALLLVGLRFIWISKFLFCIALALDIATFLVLTTLLWAGHLTGYQPPLV